MFCIHCIHCCQCQGLDALLPGRRWHALEEAASSGDELVILGDMGWNGICLRQWDIHGIFIHGIYIYIYICIQDHPSISIYIYTYTYIYIDIGIIFIHPIDLYHAVIICSFIFPPQRQVVHCQSAETQTWLPGHGAADWFHDGIVVCQKLSFSGTGRNIPSGYVKHSNGKSPYF